MNKLILFTFLIYSSILWAARLYNLEDLRILADQRSYNEFIEHALDPRPTERGDEWKTLLSETSDAYSKAITQKSEILIEDFNKIEKIWSWEQVKSSDIFKERRKEIGLRFLSSCLKQNQNCDQLIKNFWINSPKDDPELSFQLAQLLKDQKNSPLSTWDLLQVSLQSNQSEFYCQKEFVMETLWEQLSIDIIRLGPKGDLNKKIELMIHPDCIRYLNLEAKNRIEAPKNPGDREIAFHILNSQMKATEDVKDFFYTLYLLENPSRGETFNYSWNRVNELKKHQERRESVLEKFKKLDPFPDVIFNSQDEQKKKAVLTHLNESFPELIDFYLNECIQYYGGLKKYPNGNPTMNCSKFLESDLAQKMISEEVIRKYRNYKKL